MITAGIPAAILMAAEGGEEVEGVRLLIPAAYDLFWSALILLVIAVPFFRYVLPKFTAVLDERTKVIAEGVAMAESVKVQAAAALAEREQELLIARADAARLRDEARTEGTQIVAEAREHASAEAARITENAVRQLDVERQSASVQLRSEIGTLATELAERIVGESLADEARRSRVVDRFLDEIEATAAPAREH